jgi:hypothetical protein
LFIDIEDEEEEIGAGAAFSSTGACVGGGEPVARFRSRAQALFCTPRRGTAVEPA